MRTLKYIKGNLFDTQRKVIAHSVNGMGRIGSGVAGQMIRIYPEVKEAYLAKFHKDGWRLGDVQFVEIPGENLIVANLCTQKTYGGPRQHTNYQAIHDCCKQLFTYCEEIKEGVALPMIGSGLGNGVWEEIEKRIRIALEGKNVDIDIYYL